MKKSKKILMIIFEIFFLLVVIWFIFGYINFGKIVDGKEPIFTVKEKQYVVEDGTVKVYDNIIYKIVVHTSNKIKYSMKLWFMDDLS